MGPRYRTVLWVLLLGLGAPAGCVTLKDTTTPATPGQQGAPAADQAPALAYFSDNETEKLCLTAAAKFEENDCPSEAIVQLEKARTANPKLNVAHRLALMYEATGHYPQALAEYNKELAAAKQADADTLNGMFAGMKKLLGRTETKSGEAALLNDIGYCLFLKRDWAESEKYLNESLEKNPDNKTAWVNLGLTLAAQNRLEESLNASQHAVQPSEAYANIAFVQAAKLDKLAEAKESYRKALELNTENQTARAALTQLELIEKKEAAQQAVPPAPGQPG